MNKPDAFPIDVIVVAVTETAGSALYGMVDVLLAAGNIWQTLARTESVETLFSRPDPLRDIQAIRLRKWHSGESGAVSSGRS